MFVKILQNLAFLFILVVFTGTITYLFRNFQHYFSIAQSRMQTQEHSQVMTGLGKLIKLPNATPTIAIVRDPALLEKQSDIFKEAKKGDYIIVYPDRAILFDSMQNKIVKVVYSKE